MKDVELAYRMGLLFDRKITSYYFDSYKSIYGKVQVDVLNYLYEQKSATAVKLTEIVDVPKQHVSKILKRLEADGLIQSVQDDADKRLRVIMLTDKGRKLVADHIHVSDMHFRKITALLDETDKQELLISMEAIINILEKMD